MYDAAKWFDSLGECRCGRPATGILRGARNEHMGFFCVRCASRRLAKDEREREDEMAAALKKMAR